MSIEGLLQLGGISYYVVLPILLMAGCGYLLQKKLGLDMQTLTRLNFYFIIPCFIFHAVVSTHLTIGVAGTVSLFTILVMGSLTVLTLVVRRLFGVAPDQRNAMLMTVLFYNSGNYGLPLLDLAYRASGTSEQAMLLQSIVIIIQNLSGSTIGVFLAASGKGQSHFKQVVYKVLTFPPLYALTAAVITVQIRSMISPESSQAMAHILRPFWEMVEYTRHSLVAFALCTLGAQLACIEKHGPKYPVRLSVIIRLIMAPAIGVGLIYLLGLKGFMAQVLLISTAMPTAVNPLLLSLQFDNHPDYVARAVLFSTLLSPITMTLVVYLAQQVLFSG